MRYDVSKQSDVMTVAIEELCWRALIDAGTSYGSGIKIDIKESWETATF